MIPRKKDPNQTPDPITSPVEEECEICQEAEGECCSETPVSKNNKNTTS